MESKLHYAVANVKRIASPLMSPSDSDDTVRLRAQTALGKIGPHARAAVPALIKVLHDDPRAMNSAAEGPVKLLVGAHSLMALVDEPKLTDENRRRLLPLKSGDHDIGASWLRFARIHGKMNVWAAPTGITMTLKVAPASEPSTNPSK